MDQMIARLAFDQQQRMLAVRTDELRKVVGPYSSEPLIDRVAYLLQMFATDQGAPTLDTEVEFVAAVRAFLLPHRQLAGFLSFFLRKMLSKPRYDKVVAEKVDDDKMVVTIRMLARPKAVQPGVAADGAGPRS